MAPAGWRRLAPAVPARRGLARREPRPTARGMDGGCRGLTLEGEGPLDLGLRAGRQHDRGDGLQKVAQGKPTNPAALIAKTAPVLVDPWTAEDLHPRGATLVGCRRRDDAFWIKILGLYVSGVHDDALHTGRASRAKIVAASAPLCKGKSRRLIFWWMVRPARWRPAPVDLVRAGRAWPSCGHSGRDGRASRCRSSRGRARRDASCTLGFPRTARHRRPAARPRA
jgi:hypothetical protein